MSIDRINPNPALRLVQPTQPAQPFQPIGEVSEAQPSGRSFEDVYQTQRVSKPNVSLIEAQRRLEKIRKIIAAQTQVPIHFDATPYGSGPANPYMPSYLKFPTNPADLNASATEHAAGE